MGRQHPARAGTIVAAGLCWLSGGKAVLHAFHVSSRCTMRGLQARSGDRLSSVCLRRTSGSVVEHYRCGDRSRSEAMAHQNAGKEHRKRCHGTAEHTAV